MSADVYSDPLITVAIISFVLVLLFCTILFWAMRPTTRSGRLACILFPAMFVLLTGSAWAFSTFFRDGHLYFIPAIFWFAVGAIAIGSAMGTLVICIVKQRLL